MTTSNTYVCAQCKGTFEKGWSDEEALAESAEIFPGLNEADDSERAVVCDTCYQKLMAFLKGN